jgi:hypothetical protein
MTIGADDRELDVTIQVCLNLAFFKCANDLWSDGGSVNSELNGPFMLRFMARSWIIWIVVLVRISD